VGAINWDINLFVERFPQIGEEISVERISRVPGGKAANAAVASARILGPGQVALIGCLGRDAVADQQIRILESEGVVVSGIKLTEDAESGQAYILIDGNGKNVINTLFGANLKLAPEDIQTNKIHSLIRESSIVALIDPPLETIEAAADFAKKNGKTVVWDAGVRSTLGMEKLSKVIGSLDYLVVNQVETKNLTGEEEPTKAWKKLSAFNKQLKLIVKLGEKGCALVTSGRTVTVPSVNLKKLGLKAVNTVGCGDAFLGMFVAQKSLGLGDKECLERANLAGALKATKPETRGSPTRTEFEKYLAHKRTGVTAEIT